MIGISGEYFVVRVLPPPREKTPGATRFFGGSSALSTKSSPHLKATTSKP